MNSEPLVTIVIPYYNAEKFIVQTLQSVLTQTISDFEIICINDGSSDNSERIVHEISDQRIQHLNKKNTGVSDSRNKGLQKARGKYVLFLDADDLLAKDFLQKRVALMEGNINVGFCCSQVIQIDEHNREIPGTILKGACSDLLEEILSYNKERVSCPSNYLFRKDRLLESGSKFPTDLSSSADRYFLVELSKVTKCGFIENGGFLYYRIHKESMSNKLSVNLVNDIILYAKKILALNYIPKELKNKFIFKTNYIFAGIFLKLKKYPHFVLYSVKALFNNPIGFLKQLFT